MLDTDLVDKLKEFAESLRDADRANLNSDEYGWLIHELVEEFDAKFGVLMKGDKHV